MGYEYREGHAITDLNNVPKEPHYAIIEIRSYWTGDSYGGSTEYYTAYYVYLNEESWSEEVRRRTLKGDNFRAFKVFPAVISTSVSVSIKPTS